MRVAVLSPVWFPVPPNGYGGIEWIVSLLADGLVEEGHEVTLFASGDSTTKARLEAVFDVAPSEWIGHTFWELRHAVSCLSRAAEYDVISDHTGLLGLALGSTGKTPFVHTVHGPLSGEPGALYEHVVAMAPHAALISVSDAQRRPKPHLPWVATCRNALDLGLYPFSPSRGDYLLFLGRMTKDKGAHRAVAVALEAGLPLKLVGKCREPLE
jgi:glycosyltransferase involved in cell wall biosynthesis